MKMTRVEGYDYTARGMQRFVLLLLSWGLLVPLGSLLPALIPRNGALACADEDARALDSLAWKERLKEITVSVKAHKKAVDLSGLEDDLKQAQTLYAEAHAEDKLCGQLIKLVGSLTRGSKDVPLATAMLRTLAEIGDPRGARYVKPYLRQRDKKQASSMLAIAVEAAADVPHASLVKPLLEIVLKSKTYGIAAKCAGTLGHYRSVKKTRSTIVETLLKTLKRSKPGGQPRMGRSSPSLDGSGGGTGGSGQGGGASARWAALSGAIPRALRRLTGQDFSGAEEWIAVLKEYKGKYGRLFTEDD